MNRQAALSQSAAALAVAAAGCASTPDTYPSVRADLDRLPPAAAPGQLDDGADLFREEAPLDREERSREVGISEMIQGTSDREQAPGTLPPSRAEARFFPGL